MVLLHIHLHQTSGNKVRVNLPHEIHGHRKMVFKKSIVAAHVDASNTHEMMYVDLPFLNHFQITSNMTSDYLPVSHDHRVPRTESDYHIQFETDEIPRAFDVYLYKDTEGTPYDFGSTGLSHVSLIFDLKTDSQLDGM